MEWNGMSRTVSTHKTAAEKAEAAAKKMAAELAARNAEAAKQKAAAERVAAELATLRGQHEGAVGEAAKLTAAVEKAAGEAAKHKGVAEKAAAALAARDAELAQAKAAAEKLRGDRDDAVGAAAGALEAGRLEAGKLRAQLEEAGVKLEEARAKLALEGAATSSAEARAGAAETCARAGAAALAAQAEEAGAKARALQALADEATSKARSATAERDEAAARARSAAAERDDVAARVRALQGQVDEEQARTCAAVARADEQEGRARTAAARAEEAEGRADDEARRASAAQAGYAASQAARGIATSLTTNPFFQATPSASPHNTPALTQRTPTQATAQQRSPSPQETPLSLEGWGHSSADGTRHDPMAQPTLLARYLGAHNIDICGLQEVRHHGSGCHTLENGYHFIWSGGTAHTNGVGALLSPDTATLLRASNAGFAAINDRILVLRFHPNGAIPMTAIVAYAPTEAADNGPAKDAFYEQLHDALTHTPAHHYILVMGDFNATTTAASSTTHPSVGRHACPTSHSPSSPFPPNSPLAAFRHKPSINDNGHRLLDLCSAHSLSITHSFFPNPPARAYTWYSRNRKDCNILDYILVRSSHLSSVHDARTAALAAEFGVARAERESLTRELARAERRGARAQDELSRGRGAGLAAGPRELPLQSTFPVYPASPSSASPQHAQLPNIIVNIPGLGELRQERSAPLGHGDDDWGEARGDPRARRASWDAGTTLAAALPTPHENFRGSRKLVPHPWADTETTGRASAGAGALRESVELVSGRAAELRQLLEKERGRGAAERQALQDALTSLQRELSEAVEERYQLQLALRSTVKDAEGAVGQRGDPPEDSSGAQPAGEAQAPPADGVKRGARRKLLADRDAGDGDGGDSAGRPGSAAGAGAASASPPLRRPASGKDPALSLLEGALRQATEDYRMLLGEVALIKTEAADHKATAHCTCDERNRLASAAFEAGVDRDRMAASLHEALAEKDRLAAALRDADKVYYAELDRLTGALGGVEAAFAEARAEVAHLERALADCRADLAGCTCGRGGGGDGNNATTTQLSTLHNSIKRRLSEARQADEAFGRQDSLPMSRERANESLTFGHQLAVVQHSESISFGPVRMLPGPLQQCQQPHQHTPLLPQPLLGPPPPPHVHVARPAPHLPTTRAALPPPPWEAADQVPGSSSNTTPGRRPKGLAPAGSPLPPAHERPAAGRPSAQQQGERAPGPGGGGAGPPGGVQQVEVVARALSAGAGASGGEGGGGRKPELARPLPPGGFL
ncbi:hypothetical protein FOA52_004552 [Chlamydomonas sp. UWO 241]|nr:hypothetical protein FOA52_004552 [Chlamydomonas sp. UWO 241]